MPKTTVEECRVLSTRDLVDFAGLAPNTHCTSGIAWFDSTTGEKTSSIGVEIETGDHQGWARIFYTFTRGARKGEEADYHVILVSTRPHFGGLRWWFLCPVKGCQRRVAKLYMPPNARYFGCRHCYDLVYRSSQEHDKKMDRFRHMSWDTLAELMRRDSDSMDDRLASLYAAQVILDRYQKL